MSGVDDEFWVMLSAVAGLLAGFVVENTVGVRQVSRGVLVVTTIIMIMTLVTCLLGVGGDE